MTKKMAACCRILAKGDQPCTILVAIPGQRRSPELLHHPHGDGVIPIRTERCTLLASWMAYRRRRTCEIWVFISQNRGTQIEWNPLKGTPEKGTPISETSICSTGLLQGDRWPQKAPGAQPHSMQSVGPACTETLPVGFTVASFYLR